MGRWVGVFACAITGLLFLFTRNGEAPAAQQRDTMPAPVAASPGSTPSGLPVDSGVESDSVRVEHQLIEVSPPPVRAPRVRPAVRSSAVGSSPGREGESRREPRFVERARRVLIGDGRYRPEPFPKPGRR
ncbi:MAG: hypothetical protein ACRD15_11880 [Vicinamibacterales bacterium]